MCTHHGGCDDGVRQKSLLLLWASLAWTMKSTRCGGFIVNLRTGGRFFSSQVYAARRLH